MRNKPRSKELATITFLRKSSQSFFSLVVHECEVLPASDRTFKRGRSVTFVCALTLKISNRVHEAATWRDSTSDEGFLWKLVRGRRIFWHLLLPALCAGKADRPKTQWCRGQMLCFQTAVNRRTAENNGGLRVVLYAGFAMPPRLRRCGLAGLRSVLSEREESRTCRRGSFRSDTGPPHCQLLGWHVYSGVVSEETSIPFVVTLHLSLSLSLSL